MAKTLYLDCFSGISGDMTIGALVDLGLPIDELRRALGSLAIDYGSVSVEQVLRAGVTATRFRVDERTGVTGNAGHHDRAHEDHHTHDHHDRHHDHGHRHAHSHEHGTPAVPGEGGPRASARSGGHHSLTEIEAAIDRSALSRDGKARAKALFQRLGEAEAAIHGTPLDKVHLHEVGALDSIIDVVGAVFGFEWLDIDEVICSPLNVGSGTVQCAHGTFPVPAPATARLLRGVPVYAGEVRSELVTPTGALLATEYARAFGPLPLMTVSSIGYGAGEREFPGHPNVLRMIVGDTIGSGSTERIVEIACEIDDMNPQLFGPLMDRLQAAGALDVFYAPVQMKKNRPGTLVTAIAYPASRESICNVLFAESTTIGVRYQELLRERLTRELVVVDTAVGPIRFKIARRSGRVVNASPEFEDCARTATARGLPIKDVQALAMKAWLDRGEP